MIGNLLADLRRAGPGLVAILLGRPGYEAAFDVSATGVARSFGAALLALPAYGFMIAAGNRYIAENAPEAAPTGVLEAAVIYAAAWLHFPIVAAFVARLLGLTGRFAPWLVVHNWAVLALLVVQASPWVLLTAGLASVDALATVQLLLLIAALFVHVRVAQAALGLPLGLAAGAAFAHVITWQLAQMLIDRGFAPAG